MKSRVFLRRGVTAIETLVSLVVGSLVALIVFRQFSSLLTGVKANGDMGGTSADVRRGLDTMADHVRNAQMCTTVGNTNVNSVLKAGSSTAFTYFTDATCGKYVTYDYSGTLLRRSEDGGSTYTTIASNVSALTFTYYKTTAYNVVGTLLATAPTTLELPLVCSILIDMTITVNGTATRISTLVRLRNSPKKTALDGLT